MVAGHVRFTALKVDDTISTQSEAMFTSLTTRLLWPLGSAVVLLPPGSALKSSRVSFVVFVPAAVPSGERPQAPFELVRGLSSPATGGALFVPRRLCPA